ncbi:hypothetical protein Lfu02_31360 [Longispora fulva]|uniref:Uncharacterized protein n=1 Tax=Longispora fulva TaxID=619741 RepID=A0A8J7GKE5_9ACTN|nr:hypothetical protein [Longispora fulva]MBG6139270.1 hypothetical protein [Longispora fulva]GIG58764.1 hypothetical protein Lfu02_31360 [Longispora fulva]
MEQQRVELANGSFLVVEPHPTWSKVEIDRDRIFDQLRISGQDPEVPFHILACVRSCCEAGIEVLRAEGLGDDLHMSSDSRWYRLMVPASYTDQAVQALAAAEQDSDFTQLVLLNRGLRAVTAKDPARLTKQGWGPWHLDASTRVLRNSSKDAYDYEVDLDQCNTSAETLDWIIQIAGKTWGDDQTVSGLVRALNDILEPQAYLCPRGQGAKLTKKAIGQLVAAAAAEE